MAVRTAPLLYSTLLPPIIDIFAAVKDCERNEVVKTAVFADGEGNLSYTDEFWTACDTQSSENMLAHREVGVT